MEASDLRVETVTGLPIVLEVSFSVSKGEIFGVVGESGSGKTTTALATLGFRQPGTEFARGTLRIDGDDVLRMPPRRLRRLRGSVISYVPQDPSTSLNPALRVEHQVAEVLRAHQDRRPTLTQIVEALARTHLPTDLEFRRRFPHQLSGGQQQRLVIAMALVTNPRIVVLDEPTTGLDVITQAAILDEVRRLRDETGVAMLYVSHDLACVGTTADRIAVMYAGRIVEQGPTAQILGAPRHPYTRGLIASLPDHRAPRRLTPMPGSAALLGARGPGCAFAPRCPQASAICAVRQPEAVLVGPDHDVRCFHWQETPAPVAPLDVSRVDDSKNDVVLDVRLIQATYRLRRGGQVVAVDGVSFVVRRAEILSLVGESGSGKSTIGRCIAGLHTPIGGEIVFRGRALAGRAQKRSREERRLIQIVFQNPGDSLNPRMRVADAIARPARLLRGLGRRAAAAEALIWLERVRLTPAHAGRYPHELSGGERQRVAIARALAAEPELIICDEVTSALDASVQAALLELLGELTHSLGVALLFITHDLGVVATISDRVLVLEHGQAREHGYVADILAAPEHPYTRALIDAAPSLLTAA